jgi:tetratricopeptide (TPR) repeat protein
MILIVSIAALLLGTPTQVQETAAVASFRAGVAAQQQGRLPEAAAEYRRAIELEPRFAEAYANLGAVLARLGQPADAIRAYERALTLNPKLTAARVNLGLAHYRAGALGSALEAFTAAYAQDSSLLQIRQLLGLVLLETGQDDLAVPHLEAAAQAAPDEVAVLFALGRAYARRGDPRTDALADRLRDLPEGRPLWHQLRGLVLQQQGRHAEALAAFDAAAALNDALPRLFVNIGVSRLSLGEHVAARRAFEQALARSDHGRTASQGSSDSSKSSGSPRPFDGAQGRPEPAEGRAQSRGEDGAAHLYLGWLDEQDDRLADAQRHAERAVALEGDVAECRGLLGRVLLKQGNSTAAIEHLERAVAAAPQQSSWRFLLAQAYQRSGNAGAAAREFAEARRLKEDEVRRERRVPSP